MDAVDAYLAKNPFTAEQTADNEIAYEKLMDVRCKLYVIYVLIRYLFIYFWIYKGYYFKVQARI